MTDPPLIDIEDLTFAYRRDPVLSEVNLQIGGRDFVSIVGPNGGGKSTLVKLMLGLLSPSRGHVRVLGGRPETVRSRVGYMPQHSQADPQFPARVMDVVLMGRLGQGWSLGPASRADRQAAIRALEHVEAAELARKRFSSLSGGQQQRVLIARAMASEPELLLLDEPMANLDLAVEANLYAHLEALSRTVTVVMVSHDLGFVSQFVRTVVCVNRRVVVHPVAEITGEIISEMYGGHVHMVQHDHLPVREDKR
jgi:zinc transport system ATP-binding protein